MYDVYFSVVPNSTNNCLEHLTRNISYQVRTFSKLATYTLASSISDTNLLLQGWQVAQFSVLHNVHTSSGDHLASYSVGTGEFVPGGKETECRLNVHLCRVQRLNIRTAIPPLPHMPPRHAQPILPLFYMLHQKRFPIKAPFLNKISFSKTVHFIKQVMKCIYTIK